jgi:LPS sulfotransferase NodH
MDETRPQRGYAVCTEARSGSSYLCRMLGATGVLGQPREWFNPGSARDIGITDYPQDPERQLAEIGRLGATPNGVYGLKIFGSHFDAVAATRWAERLPNLAFVFLQRRDLLAQAISHVRARQTQQWTSTSPATAEAVYRADWINDEMVRLARFETRWRYYFARNGIAPLWMFYEDVERDPKGAVDAVAHLVGLAEPPKIDLDQVVMRVQRDALSEDWRARFLAQSRDLNTFH